MIALVRTDPAKFGTSEDKLKLLEKMLQKIEGTVLEGAIFKVRFLFSFFLSPTPFFIFSHLHQIELVRAAV